MTGIGRPSLGVLCLPAPWQAGVFARGILPSVVTENFISPKFQNIFG